MPSAPLILGIAFAGYVHSSWPLSRATVESTQTVGQHTAVTAQPSIRLLQNRSKMTSVSADFGRGGMMTAENLAKLERLNKLREVHGVGCASCSLRIVLQDHAYPKML